MEEKNFSEEAVDKAGVYLSTGYKKSEIIRFFVRDGYDQDTALKIVNAALKSGKKKGVKYLIVGGLALTLFIVILPFAFPVDSFFFNMSLKWGGGIIFVMSVYYIGQYLSARKG